jgi:GR25 family glycosyltransferase involved in LPS biosynthesis
MKIFLINLASRPDRLAQCKVEIAKLQLSFEVIIAVTPDAVSDIKFVTPPVAACWESHRKCYETLLDSSAEFAIILEDDFIVTSAKRFWRDIEWAKKEKVDLLQLGFLLPGKLNHIINVCKITEASLFRLIYRLCSFPFIGRLKLQNRLRVRLFGITNKNYLPDFFSPGTHSYLISRKLAEQLLAMNSPQFLSADEFFISLSQMRSYKIFRSIFSSVTQSNSTPSINSRFLRR